MVDLLYIKNVLKDIIDDELLNDKIFDNYICYIDKKVKEFGYLNVDSFNFNKDFIEKIVYNGNKKSKNNKKILKILFKINKLYEFLLLYNEISEPKKDYILSPEDYFNYIKGKFSSYREEVIITHLNQKNKVISNSLISVGNEKLAYVSIKEIILESVKYKTPSLIVSHNHPSGDFNPSVEDINFTKKLKEILDCIGINLLDHIILGDNFFSMRREGYI
ncbi:MAG: hypothetical protein N3A58_00570 [Spirochaetes bacterium]|nr:hypothetical protein [Spirochaetota bacterium]